MSSKCICTRVFSLESALLRHQNNCSIYQSHQLEIVQLARENRVKRGSGRKRRRIEGPSGSTDIEVGDLVGEPSGGQHRASTPVPAAESVFDVDTDMFVIQDDGGFNATAHTDEPPAPVLTAAGRPVRENRNKLPARYVDVLPEGPPPLPPPRTPSPIVQEHPTAPDVCNPSIFKVTRTAPNSFGLIREYRGEIPLHDPEDEVPLEALRASGPVNETDSRVPQTSQAPEFGPYPNISSFMLGNWFWSGGPQKSKEDLKRLSQEVLQSPDFKTGDLKGVSWDKIDKQLSADDGTFFDASDGWIKSSVTIKVPFGNKDIPPQDFVVEGLYHRPLVDVIRRVAEDPSSKDFQYTPYHLIWQPPFPDNPPEETVYGELYTSKAFLDAHEELQRSPREKDCNLPRAIMAQMVWSDSTQLTDFSSASLWPAYELFGNQSKYPRGKPRAHACHHVVYFPKLSDEIQDFIRKTTGKSGSPQLLTHCRRELMHAMWKLLLDDEFRRAYEHGIVVHCSDGIWRRLYPRLFTYSADYPEKTLLATIRDLGSCPCPRCLVSKDKIPALGQKLDMRRREQTKRVDNAERRRKVAMARSIIYEKGFNVNSAAVERILKEESLVPTENAFSARLGDLGFDFFPMLVVDFLHEWELGVWKQILTHLIRILHAVKGDRLAEFNTRFRQVPHFGRDTIRRFGTNVGDLKQFAAREYEDVLQCIIPVFEGLLPEPHNSIVMHLLFLLAYTHALGKMRMHTDSTLVILEKVTAELGKAIRKFERVTCQEYQTTELPKEAAARVRREARNVQQTTGNAAGASSSTNVPQKPRMKQLNLSTYKLHAIGDYPSTIRMFGTSDSYTTQIGEQEHRRAKARYSRTSKKGYTKQLADIERRESHLRQLTHNLRDAGHAVGHKFQYEDFDEDSTPPDIHHFIGKSQKKYHVISDWLRKTMADPATKEFVPKLKNHLLSRLRGSDNEEPSFTEDERRKLAIKDERIYTHQILRVNYTTYDIRRDYDTITPQRDVMVLAPEEDTDVPHRFWYARVLGIYHANVIELGIERNSTPKRVEFLHVRWFGRDLQWKGGWNNCRLDRVGFIPESDPDAFGFIDPADVIRGCHLIPAFIEGRTMRLLGLSRIARPESERDDWDAYYVNRFVDRDMVMRYVGRGVGHLGGTYQMASGSALPNEETEDLEQDDVPSSVATRSADNVQDQSDKVVQDDEPLSDSETDSEPEDDFDGDDEPETGDGEDEFEEEEGYASL